MQNGGLMSGWGRVVLLVGAIGWLSACAPSSFTTLRKTPNAYVISFPKVHATVQLADPTYRLEIEEPGRPYYLLVNDTTGVDISFMFDRPTECTSSRACRDYGAKQYQAANPELKDFKVGEIGDVPVYEYTSPPVSGFDLKQHHMNAHFVTDEVWVDVHLSKVSYEPKDHELFERAVRAIGVQQTK